MICPDGTTGNEKMTHHNDQRPGTYYDILQVDRRASTSRVKSSYRRLVRALHPDLQNTHSRHAEEKLRQLNEAYACLRNQKRRKAYDRLISRKKIILPRPQKAVNDNGHSVRAWNIAETLAEIFWPFDSNSLSKNIRNKKEKA